MTAPSPADEPTSGAPDAPPAIDPVIEALYRPPFQPQTLRLHLDVRVDEDGIWCQVPELPGLFATGSTIPELSASLGEAVQLYLMERTTIVRPEEPGN